MGCGRNGSFDKHPDWNQWAILLAFDNTSQVSLPIPSFFKKWWRLFGCKQWLLLLNPIEGHGTWDSKNCFGNLPKQTDYAGKIAVLTRATIRLNRLKNFWQHVNPVAEKMATSEGFIKSVGIGEVPWIKQATFSIWESKEHMKTFAYKLKEHAAVVKKTYQEKWYSEEMFVRFEIIAEKDCIE